MKRTVIGTFADGHLFVDRQAEVVTRKITGDKRKAQLPTDWQRIGRTIVRNGVCPAGDAAPFAISKPGSDPEIAAQALENDRVAAAYTGRAAAMVDIIDKTKFTVAPPRKMRVVFVYDEAQELTPALQDALLLKYAGILK